MNRRTPVVIVAAAWLTSAFVAWNADDGELRDSSLADAVAGVASVLAEGGAAPSVAVAGDASPSRVALEAASKPQSARSPVTSPLIAATDGGTSAIQVGAPEFVEPGAPHELMVSFRLSRGARHVEFTLLADPDLVELRDASRGEGSPRGETAFEASVDEVANRIAIDIEREDGWPQDETVSLAIVRFEGVAAGSATITASDIVVRDAAGVAMPVASSAATTQLLVMSGPI